MQRRNRFVALQQPTAATAATAEEHGGEVLQQRQFSECDWRLPETNYNKAEIHVSIFTAVEELRRRLLVVINRWLVPASVYTLATFRRFVFDKMLCEDLMESPEDSYKVYVAADSFNLVQVATGNMLDLVIGSEEYNARYLLLLSLVDPVLAAVTELLTAETERFLRRTMESATPPESGILTISGSPYVIPILYGRFTNVLPSVKTWEINLHRREQTFFTDRSTMVFDGIVRMVLAHFRHAENQRRQDSAQLLPGSAAALLFTEQMSERFTDFSATGMLYVEGATVPRDSEALVTTLAEMLAVDKTFVAQQLLNCNALAPPSAAGVVNVLFVVENILFALQQDTLRLPTRFITDYARTRARFWVMARTRLRRALVLAFENPHGVSARKLKAFAQSCGTSGKVFTHAFRCFHVLTQGVMAGQVYGRREIGMLERAMTDISTAEDTMKTRGEFPAAGPWKRAVKYTEDGEDAVLCFANLVEELADAVRVGVLTRKRWEPKAGMFMQSGLPGKEWEYQKTDSVPDPGNTGVWRVLNAFLNIKELNAGAGVGKIAYRDTNACPEVLHIAFAETVPTIIHLVNGMCYSRETREVSPCMLPVFVLLWNAAMVLRRRIRDTATETPVVAVSARKTLPRARKKQRLDDSSDETAENASASADADLNPRPSPGPPVIMCVACMESRSVQLLGCPHDLCAPCGSAMLEARVTDLFSGKGGVAADFIPACPHPGCDGRMKDATVISLVPPEVHAMLLFVTRPFKKAEAVYCNMCGACAPETFMQEIDGAVFTCNACGVKTCCQCERAAHPGDACVRRVHGLPTPEDLLSQAKIQQCPTCAVPEVKHRNCNHVLCKMCKTDWCWACSGVLDSKDISMHYKDSPECVLYSTETETERMRLAILAKATPETSDAVQCALKLLVSSSLQQMESDI